ncbi:MAG: hypothetical protein CHACPFDD_03687 [Phycisphaerae bacterium]|nr:hypothetical protein [Phycisphaerae bacterium]
MCPVRTCACEHGIRPERRTAARPCAARVATTAAAILAPGLVLLLASPASGDAPNVVWIRGGHNDEVRALQFLPDGTGVISSDLYSESGKSWNVADGLLRRQYFGSASADLAVSPDGRLLVAAAAVNKVRVFAVATGAEAALLDLPEETEEITAVAFASDNRTAAAGGWEGVIRVWDVVNRNLIVKITQQNIVAALTFSPDGKTLASGSGNDIKLWDAANGMQKLSIAGHTERVTSLSFSPDGKLIASGSDDKLVRIWDAGTGAEKLKFKNHEEPVNAVAFSPDGKAVASGGSDYLVRLWDPTNGQESAVLKGHTLSVRRVAWSPDGKHVASCGNDGSVRLWEVATAKEVRRMGDHSDEVRAVAFSPNSALLASGSFDRTARLWDAADGKPRLADVNPKHKERVIAIAFAPDGKSFATSSNDENAKGIVQLFETATGNRIRSLAGHDTEVPAIAYSQDGKMLASCDDLGGDFSPTIILWDPANGEKIRTINTGRRLGLTSLAFSPDGKKLVSGCADRTAQVWNTANGDKLATLSEHTDVVTCVAVSPDGKSLVTGGRDSRVVFWDSATYERKFSIFNEIAVVQVAFSPTGIHLMVAAESLRQTTIRVFSSKDGKVLKEYDPNTKYVRTIAYSPDNRLFAYGRADGTIVAARPPCDPCDVNCDGKVDGFDIDALLGLLFNQATPCSHCAGDCNGDGVVNGFDIDKFVECLK